MPDVVVLLRAIGPGNSMPMADLRTMCREIGFQNPETYIQTGNVILGARQSAGKVEEMLEAAIKKSFGLDIEAIARLARDWEAYRDGNPFIDDATVIPKMVHLALSKRVPKAGAVEALQGRATQGERIRQAGDAIWIDYGEKGAGRSKLTPSIINRAVGSPVTTRNWNTVRKLQELIEARA